jgi:hypothetical protein
MRCAMVLVLGAVAAMLVGVLTPAVAAPPTGDPAQGGGVDGQVYATLVVGNTLYVGGSFDNALVQGGASTTRTDLAAFDRGTGALLGAWQANTDAIVRSLASDGSYLYVGGDFTTIGGVAQGRLARVSLTTGAVDTGFAPKLGGSVRAVAVGNGAVFAGGGFTMSGGTAEQDLAKFDADTGAKMSAYTASTNGAVDVLALDPSGTSLAVGGNFTSLSGSSRVGLGLVDPTSGAVVGPSFAFSVAPMLTLSWSDDGTALFGGSGNFNNVAARWNPGTGARSWHLMVGGDVQAVAYDDGNVYVGFHDNYLGDTHTKLLALDATSGAVSATFRPTFNQFYGVRSISAGPWGLVVGGQFTRVSDVWAHNVASWPTRATPVISVDSPATSKYGSAVDVDVSIPGATGAVTLQGAGPDAGQDLANGAASFTLPRRLAVGSYTLSVSYSGDSLHTAGTASATLVVTKAGSKVGTTVVRKPTKHRRGKVEVTVASKTGGGLAPTGTVRIRLTHGGKHRTLRGTVKAGKAKVTLPRLGVGKWRIVATYGGDAGHKAAKHRSTVKVGK